MVLEHAIVTNLYVCGVRRLHEERWSSAQEDANISQRVQRSSGTVRQDAEREPAEERAIWSEEESSISSAQLPVFAYRNTPHTVTGKTLAEVFLRRAPRTRLYLLKPSLKAQVEKKQEQQEASHDDKCEKM